MNPVLLQKQLKENANDLQDFYKDLKSWGEEMKRKEDSLKNKEDTSKKPRIQASKAPPKLKDVDKEKKSKSGSTDYARWEKFNADLECERLEDDIKDDSELTDEFEESARDEALAHKEKGNSYVKIKEWDKAIDCYTKAINCYSYDPVFYANRALCYLKKNSFIAAEEDCTLSLRLDSTYVKALQRRAAARESLEKLVEAERDLEMILTHEPKNKESTAVLECIRKKMGKKPVEDEQRPVSKFTASRTKTQPVKPIITNGTIKKAPQEINLDNSKIDTSIPTTSGWPDPECDIFNVKAINKPPHLQSKRPLKRIEITEINSFSQADNTVIKDILIAPKALNMHVVEHIKQFTCQDNIEDANKPVERTSALKKNREKVDNEKNDILNKNAWPKAGLKTDIRSDDLQILEKKTISEIKAKEAKNTENIFITKMDSKTSKDVMDSKQDTHEKQFSVPKTSVQFYSTWKTIKTSDEKYKYFKLIDPQEIPKIFRESLDTNVFSSILDVLSTSFIEKEDEVYDFLFQLTQVKRFSALAMFMDSTDKNRLWKLITYLREQNIIPVEQVDNLVLKYEL